MSDPAHPLTLWLARASAVSYAVAVLIAVSNGETTGRNFRRWRAAWSAACLLLIIHVAAAFHFEHAWSHSAALNHTAQQTARVTSINRGEGLYFNYVFLILWLLDVAILWTAAGQPSTTLRRSTEVACVFMFFNATVVFGPRGWIGPAVAFAVAAVWLRRRKAGSVEAADSTSLE
jgi:hypothetical protein